MFVGRRKKIADSSNQTKCQGKTIWVAEKNSTSSIFRGKKKRKKKNNKMKVDGKDKKKKGCNGFQVDKNN